MLKVTFSWVTTTSPSKTHKPYKNHTTAKLPYLDRIDWESTIVVVLLCITLGVFHKLTIELIEGWNKKEMKREEGMERREKRTRAICWIRLSIYTTRNSLNTNGFTDGIFLSVFWGRNYRRPLSVRNSVGKNRRKLFRP